MVEEGRIFPVVDFDGARHTAATHIPEVLDLALAEAGLPQVDAGIVAHVDPETEVVVQERLGDRVGRFIARDELYSYSASLPVALAGVIASGALTEGETLALMTAGSGASWGAAVLRVG
jgi:3-oxoacyl-[acyl-carrier-protein] synthase III